MQSLMIETLKIKNELAPSIMDYMFKRWNKPYNLCNFQEFLSKRKRTVHYSLEKPSYRSSQLRSLQPENIKEIESVKTFNIKVKSWICDDCP